ncbi:membrane protein insertase YidC [Candidatus Peregrinibacteria bacterium]|nr:membrane protein insertase YidC [Candidatus Peregrinibacteria bacterium]
MNKNFLLGLILLFGSFLLLKNFLQPQTPILIQEGVAITTDRAGYDRGQIVSIKIANNTNAAITLPADCPKEPFDVFASENNIWVKKEAISNINCKELNIDQEIILQPGASTKILYNYWNHQLFGAFGKYKISIPITINNEQKIFTSNEFNLQEESFFKKIWLNFFYRPLYNVLIAFAQILPYHSLGGAIILLTLLIRTILLIPSQRAMKAQKKMQEMQPHLEEIKKKYKDDQQRLTQETMALWREHRVNPFGSCLPLLVQFPVLIAVFNVVQNGINPDSIYLLYEPLKNFPLSSISTLFLGILDLQKNNLYVLPVIVGGLQFLQMKLSMAKIKSKTPTKEKTKDDMPDIATINRSMMYFMPFLIAFFTASVPSGVGLYWGVSTLFGLGQQIVINRQSDDEKVKVEVVKQKH